MTSARCSAREGPRVPDRGEVPELPDGRRQDADFAGELPSFVAEIREIFATSEIRSSLESVRRVGALGHICDDAAYAEFRDAGAIDEDPVEWAREILLVERAKRLLL